MQVHSKDLDELQDRAAQNSRYGNEWAKYVFKLIKLVRLYDEKLEELDLLMGSINDLPLADWYDRTSTQLGDAKRAVVEE